MQSAVYLTLDEYNRLKTGWDELETWNQFMDSLDENRHGYEAALAENPGKPGRALFVAFEHWKVKHA